MKKSRFFVFLICLAISVFSWMAFAAPHTDALAVSNKNSNNQSFTPAQTKDIKKIIHDYLVKNPEVLIEASNALHKKEKARMEKAALSMIRNNIESLFNDPNSPVIGNTKGKIQMVEFFDYQCGHCKVMNPIIAATLKNNPNIKMIFKELPIFGGASHYAAEAALASTKQGKYYKFHNALFTAKSPLNSASILRIAKKIGLNVAKLKKAISAPWVNQEIRNNFALAAELKLIGTPALVISNKAHTKFAFIPGETSASELKKKIAETQ